MKRLAILGASGHGKVVADTAELCGWGDICFFDDAFPSVTSNASWSVCGTSADLLQQIDGFDAVLVAIGNNHIRLARMEELHARGASLAKLVHPQAVVSRYAEIGPGSVVFAAAVVNAGAIVGPGCILNTSCSVDHDCQLGRGVHISPGAHLAGGVVVGDASWLGIGSCVRQLSRIGSSVVVGAGAAVVDDVPDNVTVVGVPARVK